MFSANNLLTGSDDVLQYIQDNLILFVLLALCVIAIIVIIVILAVSKKKKKNPAVPAPEEEPAQTEATTEPTGEAAQAEEGTVAAEAASLSLTVRTKGELQTTQQEQTQQTEPEAPAEPTGEAAQTVAAESAENTTQEPMPASDGAEPAEEDETELVVDKGVPADESEDTEEPPVAFAAEEADESAAIPYAGKWEVFKLSVTDALGNEKDSAFFFRLKASNGESLITSEDYTSLRGAWQGIETFKSNIARGNFKISITRKGKFIVKLLTNQGNLLAQGEKYSTRTQAMSAIASIKRFAETAIRDDEVKTNTVPYRESNETERTYDPEKRGKWVIHKVIMESENDASYCFELRASNGQVLFTSEEYATVASLKNGIKTHKKNIENGNIRAAVTRNGDYIFKIFSGNGQLLCLGGHYKTRQLCESAIESVKHFAQDARLDLDKIFPDEK